MEELNHILERFTDPLTGSLHGAVFIAIDRSGKVIYNHAAGKATFDTQNASVVSQDSLCWIASMTKLATAVAVMQLVERGIVSLEDDVREIIPELRDIEVFIDDNASTRKADSAEGYNHPLIFQPGTSWGYGGGIDWSGRLVEIVTKSTLEEYMKKNIWSKLGANSTTFRPELHRDTLSPPLEMGYRLSIGHGEKSIKQGPIILGQPAEHNLGGIGLFSTPTDYMKLLSSLLGGGYPLLSESSIDILFQPQLSEASRMAMPKPLGSQMRRVLGIKCLDDHTQADHCLAGTMTLKDIPGRRRAGTVNWSGLPNLHWWIDRQTGITAALFTQLMPAGDAAVTGLLIELEVALYKALKVNADYSSSGSKL
ncbi:hypothetical protein N7467_010905 [Penicillium canescens]|nr:hypothetical protein N7467_010905 [Penicillium canescens]